MELSELQRSIAASLVRAAPPPPGCSPTAVDRARRGLVTKRSRAVAEVLPRLRGSLGSIWDSTFALHAAEYVPTGTRLTLDDAWELADRCCRREQDADVRIAALDDLLELRLRYRRTAPGVIERRRSLVVGLFRQGGRRLVVRLPGAVDRVLTFP